MKDRIFQIMKQEHLNQKEFAAITGISPATLSSIFNGRTSPTLNHAEALHRRFPRLSMTWLMFGEGEMYVDEPISNVQRGGMSDSGQSDLFSAAAGEDGENTQERVEVRSQMGDYGSGVSASGVIREVVKFIDKPQRKITEIRIFFDDGRFETFPGK